MNNPSNLFQKRDGAYCLSGELSFDTVPQLWQQSQEALKNKAPSVVFDLAEVTQSDSSGVALLIAWTRSIRRQSRTIHFMHLPKQMLAIIQLAGLKNIIPIKI